MFVTGTIFVPLLLLHLVESGAFGAVFLPPGQVGANKEHNFICQSSEKKPISACYFQVPGFEGEIKIFDTVSTPRYASAGEGLQKGECGLRLRAVNKNNTGQFKCKLTLDDLSQQTAETQVDVLYPVDHVGINSNSKLNDYEYKENELMQITCTADGNPEPKITLFIGGEKMSESQGSTLVFKTLAKPEYHNKELKCEAMQPEHQIAENRTLAVYFQPRLVETSNVMVPNQVTVLDGKATIQVWSNPPTVEHQNRLTRNGVDVKLRILKDKPITEYSWPIENYKTDLEADWKLEVSNSNETVSFNLKMVAASTPKHQLLTSETTDINKGKEGSNVGLIAGVVVFVLVLLFMLLVLLLMLTKAGVIWYQKKLCSQNYQRRETERRKVYKFFDKLVYIFIKCRLQELDTPCESKSWL